MIVLSTALVLSACAPSLPSKTAGLKRAKDARNRLEFKDGRGRLVVDGTGKALPSDFPADMPIYKPSQVKGTVASRGAGETTMTMTIFKADAKVAEVAVFYQNSLPASGWTIDSTAGTEPGAVMLVAAKDNQTGSISIRRDKGIKATIISINVVNK